MRGAGHGNDKEVSVGRVPAGAISAVLTAGLGVDSGLALGNIRPPQAIGVSAGPQW